MDINRRSKFFRMVIGCMSLLLMQLNSTSVNADGTETLGPATVILEDGTGIISAGIGVSVSQPGDIVFDVPAGYTVEQVLLYWEGNQSNIPPDNGMGDADITVNAIPVTGTRIMLGGTLTLGSNDSSAYRADITSLGQVSAGATNTLTINGMNFSSVNHGAGVLVIVNDNASDLAHIDVLDGNDYAFINAPPGDQTHMVPQTFIVPSSSAARTANLEMFFSSVAGTASTGGFRPTAIDVTVGGTTTTFNNLLDSIDGQEWDTIAIDVPVPANETVITVEPMSVHNNNDNIPAGITIGSPASFHWLAAGLSIAPPPPPPGGEGCTPGFWKNTKKHLPAWVGHAPRDPFSGVFEDAFPDGSADGSKSLKQVLKAKGGGLNALGRHTVAALLNAANSDIDYGMTETDVIDAFNAVYPGTKAEYTALKNVFAAANESGCPINGKTAPSDS